MRLCLTVSAWDSGNERVIIVGADKCWSYDRLGGDGCADYRGLLRGGARAHRRVAPGIAIELVLTRECLHLSDDLMPDGLPVWAPGPAALRAALSYE